jgi:tryptophanyl-tRNA synthetase
VSTPALTKRTLSGVQASGKLHIGNYFGAIKQHIERQESGDCFYFIADYHALTTLKEIADREIAALKERFQPKWSAVVERLADVVKPGRWLEKHVRDAALDYLALGLDPRKAAFYRQSDVPEVTELTWILSTVTGMGLLERAHSYKDKVAKGISPSAGLFFYPVLMAADILIVRSHLVPVGKDQEQHLEMTRDMAGAFNHAYGDVFPLPEAVYSEAPVVPGTDGQKMSKSYGNTIEIFAEGEALKKTVMGIVTDSTPAEAPKNPDTCTVFKLLQLLSTPSEMERVAAWYRDPMLGAEHRGGKPFGYGMAKQLLHRKIDTYFAPFRERRKELEKDPGVVEEALSAGAKRAREVAQVTLRLVRRAVGMGERPL